jgi:nitroimidazol reductase NimA-like FMN-containing flavoprotein (pyridoxamine 5'-phosphate oxidase superfamily)
LVSSASNHVSLLGHDRVNVPSARTRVRRAPQRGSYDRTVVDAILDEAIVCHLGLIDDAQPFVIPTLHARVGDVVFVHGASSGRALRILSRGLSVCLTVTLVDGIVLARSAFHHSINYRSVVLLGQARPVTDPAEKLCALEAFTEQLLPGRWSDVRPPNDNELKATAVLALSLNEVSAKVRTGPPNEEEADYSLNAWAGVIPLRLTALVPEDDPRLRPGIQRPAQIGCWGNRRAARQPPS